MTTKIDGTNGVIFPDGTTQSTAGVAAGSTQLAKAWVNFNGTTSPGTIRASYNVSSVSKNSTGVYTINFTSAFADANYSAVANGSKYTGGNDGNNTVAVGSITTPPASGSCQIGNFTSTVGTTDNTYIFFVAFR